MKHEGFGLMMGSDPESHTLDYSSTGLLLVPGCHRASAPMGMAGKDATQACYVEATCLSRSASHLVRWRNFMGTALGCHRPSRCHLSRSGEGRGCQGHAWAPKLCVPPAPTRAQLKHQSSSSHSGGTLKMGVLGIGC